MKKVLAIVLALVMVLSFAACEEKKPTTKTVKVGVSIYQFDDNFMTLYREELKKYIESKSTDDVKYEVTVVDGKNDMATQSEQIDTFITQKMDVIILNLVQTSSAESIVKKINDAKIPCILINREPAEDVVKSAATVCYVGADARQSGTFEGEIIRDLENHGDINGDGKVSYVMVVGDPENSDAQYRTEYSIKALTDANIQVEKLVQEVGNWKQEEGERIVSTALTQYADKIEVVFCNNDAMALGAAQAIKTAGRTVGKDIYLVGVDALQECQEMVQAGTMTGTVLNDHIGQSHAAGDAAIKAAAGEAIEHYYWVDYVKVK